MTESPPYPRRVLQVIARMNVGGAATQVSLLSSRLDRRRYQTVLVHGMIGPGEASFRRNGGDGCPVHVVPELGRAVDPIADLKALAGLVRVIRTFDPHVVHTHTAKAGVLGRLAAMIARRPRPVVVHTYHGHVLEGYFGASRSLLYRGLEGGLARVSDCLVAVSQATVDELVRLRVAARQRFRVIPIGLELERLASLSRDDGRGFRAHLGVAEHEVLLVCLSRLVPIKRVDLLLHAVAEARQRQAPVRLVVVGDGASRPHLEALASELGLNGAVGFTGYLLDVDPVLAASDVAVLTSANEGTPVSLIEAAAAGVPAVATAVGGVPEVVTEETGVLVDAHGPRSFADALVHLSRDRDKRLELGSRARDRALERFSAERNVERVERLYDELLARAPLTDALAERTSEHAAT